MTAVIAIVLALFAQAAADGAPVLQPFGCDGLSTERGRVICAISSVFGAHTGAGVRIASCESKLDPRAQGAAGEKGLMQVHPIHRKRVEAMGYTWEQMTIPAFNLVVAKAIYDEQGWAPWSCQP